MSIVKLKPDAQPPIQTTLPDTIQAPNKSIFTTLLPEAKIHSLLKYVEGYPWTVDFYGQILNRNNTLEHFDPSTPNLTQPYYKVSKLIIQVDSPLSSSYDQTTGITTITGSALAPFGLIPNVGDLFIAQVDSGEDAIFIITTVARKTHRKDTLYEISYSLYSYTSARPEFLQTLSERINEVYFFNPDTNFFNRDVLLKPSVKEAKDRLTRFLHESKDYYFSKFLDTRLGTLVIPGMNHSLYDPHLINFLLKTVSFSSLLKNNFFIHNHSDVQLNQPSIIHCLLTCSRNNLNTVNRTYSFIPTNMLANRARFGTLFHAGINYTLYPTDPDTRTFYNIPRTRGGAETLPNILTTRNNTGINPIISLTSNNNQIYTKPLLHELFKDDYYIVTENFYSYLNRGEGYDELSYIELLISNFLQHKAIPKEDLAITVERYDEWPLIHQVYLLPVLWHIIQATS